jgi:predicted SprT family Zn-dependent metalloprotease
MKMELAKARELAMKKMMEHGLMDWSFRFSYGKRMFGVCNYTKKQIRLSEKLTLLNSEERVLNTILHEIAHAMLPPGARHGYEWKELARSIGCSGERVYKESNTVTIQREKPAIAYECINCHKVYMYYKTLRRMHACGECCKRYHNNKFSVAFVLKKV